MSTARSFIWPTSEQPAPAFPGAHNGWPIGPSVLKWPVLDSPTPRRARQHRTAMSDARAKLYINTGVVTDKTDIYNILRPLLKQTVSYAYYRGNQVES